MGKKKESTQIKNSKETVEKVKQVNFQMPVQVHFKAKVTAMEMGKSLKEYLTDLVIDDLSKRGKM